MEKNITKQLMCISMRNGAEIWIEKDKMENLQIALKMADRSKFIEIDEEFVNTADIVGIFKAQTMEDLTRRKNGQWKCQYGKWHERAEKCLCGEIEEYILR